MYLVFGGHALANHMQGHQGAFHVNLLESVQGILLANIMQIERRQIRK